MKIFKKILEKTNEYFFQRTRAIEAELRLLKRDNIKLKSRLNRHNDLMRLQYQELFDNFSDLKSKIKPRAESMYDSIKMFTYILDRDFSIEQKKWFISKSCYRRLGYFPNLENPKTFNEKTQWYKLYYRDPLITRCIDKYFFKEYISETVGARYVAPLLGAWKSASEVDFDALPNQFVLKSNWGSGGRHVLTVKDKSKLDLDATRMLLCTWLQPWENVYFHTFDWGYKDIDPLIIAETLLDDKENDYSFFCFNGIPKFSYVITAATASGESKTMSYFDMEWNLLPFITVSGRQNKQLEKPKNFDEMVELSKKLSAPFPHVRVDFMNTDSGLYIAELTFYTGSGTGRFYPAEWDAKSGDLFHLPQTF